MTRVPELSVKHASAAALRTDGMRVLVERHWPVGKRRDILRLLHELGRRGPVTLLHTTRDPERNNAAALRRILDELA